MYQIDINCDTGEGIGNEALLMPLIGSCNIACGGHAGDMASMEMCVSLARKHGVRIGAHPSYPDREHFGRQSLVLAPDVLQASLQEQLRAMDQVLESSGAPLHHIKAHGALYNDLAVGGALAATYLQALAAYRGIAALYAPAGSAFADQAREAGYAVIEEAFGDRAYQPDGRLVPRTQAGAVLHTPEAVLAQLLEMVFHERVRSLQGAFVPLKAQTFCIHGDTAEAYEILAYLARELPKHQIQFSP
ncbi:5-oxoprolinase subunit PxpA [Robiginitalea sp. M366]|uniref:5-oxoprolinase subunit PxpA n=1 Tax=Robiginitalea aestuariiviva TaxID=3036903 RepID=UPI00240E1CCC|nr:5-oxoprolinase subunit PxpA [Robiginitalea aestuariiviva]MDG1572832.1 5-oxoprolinase subunit PxpA [Robiginitalea aestuariiviva]